jgi:hypothetical protein
MSQLGLSITLTGEGLTAPARALLALRPEKLGPVVGIAAHDIVTNRLALLSNSRKNQLGGKSTRFYGRALRATTWKAQGGEVTVSIAGPLGIRQRFYGGTIKPRPGKKYLTIPVAPEAHGRSAGSFGGELEVIFGQGGRPIGLARKAQGKRKFGVMLYRLVRSVTQRPDPTILPKPAETTRHINNAIERHVAVSLKK